MLFNSLTFALFLPVVFAVYWLLRSRTWQNRFLLAASYFFYGWWDWRFLFLIAGCSAVNFVAGLVIQDSAKPWLRRTALTVCCVVCLGALCLFKYLGFFVQSFVDFLALAGIHVEPLTLHLLLPVGISFFTFQALSYTVDVYLGKLRATRSWVEFFVFIAFFPQLVAGPIERATNLLPQFQRERRFDREAAEHGVCLMLYGLFKKMAVADLLALYVDKVFGNVGLYSSVTALIGAFFFSLQIYCDFSGYSDMARGMARLFGIELMLNFDRPYLSRSFGEFWRRWHISLSTWFKDYLYIPLGGNRVSPLKHLRNLWIVFLVSGLWHGAAWTFIAWGALHAIYLTGGWLRARLFPRRLTGALATVLAVLTVNVGAVFAWIFFRADSLADAMAYLRVLFTGGLDTSLMALCAGTGPMSLAFMLAAVAMLGLSYLAPRDCRFRTSKGRLAFAAAAIVVIAVLGQPTEGAFIYFQF